MAKLIHTFQLRDMVTGQALTAAGGKVAVCEAGSYGLAGLTDPNNDFATLANPVSLTRGTARFAVDEAINSVDLYGLSGGGIAFHAFAQRAQALPWLNLNTQQGIHQLMIPFDAASQGAAEVDTGFDEPADAAWLPYPLIDVKTIDATETIDVGTATADTGDPNGFIAALSVATAGIVKPGLASGAQTLGALLRVDESGAGGLVPESHPVGAAPKSIVFDLSAGSDTAAGVIVLPYQLVNLTTP